MTAAELHDLEEILRALANQNRLKLLHVLRSPHVTAELNLSHPSTANVEHAHARSISRQALGRHLDQLRAAGLVQRDPNSDPRQPSYVVNPEGMKEGMRKLYAALVQTSTGGSVASPPEGPHVIVLDAPQGEYTIPLDPSHASWSVGCRPGVTIELEFDPVVQPEHAHIIRTGNEFGLLPVQDASIMVNFAPIREPATIRHGDIVTVGGTRLAFRNP